MKKIIFLLSFFAIILCSNSTYSQTLVASHTQTSYDTSGGVSDWGQSFTALASGDISSFELAYSLTISSGTYKLYEGEGYGGTVISSGNLTNGTGDLTTTTSIVTFPDGVSIISGAVYTMRWSHFPNISKRSTVWKPLLWR